MIKGLIFDFDGLIVDTEWPIFQTWQELYQAHGCQIDTREWLKLVGTAELFFDPAKELERMLGRPLDWKTIRPQLQQRETELIASQPPLPGAPEILHSAQTAGLKIGLASSSTCNWVTSHLTRLGLIQYFDRIVASDDVKRTKPDPELFQSALAALDLQPEQAVVFEDSLNGILAARQADIFCVAVPNALTRELSMDLADLRLNSLADISLADLLDLVEERQRSR